MDNPLTLPEAQQRAWENQRQHPDGLPKTIKEALSRLSAGVRDCQETFDAGQLVPAQMRLEETLAQVLIAMKMLGMNPERGLERALQREQQTAGLLQKVFHFYTDRVEIRTSGEIRGEWPLYSEQEYLAALQLARELGCEVVHSEARQLELFAEGR